MFKDVNGALPTSIEIDEVSLSASMKEEDRAKKEHKWRGQDDGSHLLFNERPKDMEGFKGIALEP